MKKSGIYQIRNNINDKRYIGSTIDIKSRFHDHLKVLRKGTHYNTHLQKDWNIHGEVNFKFEIILYCKKEDLLDEEQKRIDCYKIHNGKGYNIAPFAGTSKGIPCLEKTKLKISKSNKGKIRSEKVKMNMSAMRIGHIAWNKGMPAWNKGKKLSKLSEETKMKITQFPKTTVKELLEVK